MNSRQKFIFSHFVKIITLYKGITPFRHFFKNYCKTNKSLGSKDRKILKEIFYFAFRSGKYETISHEQLFLLPNGEKANEMLIDFYNGLEKNTELYSFIYPFDELLNIDFQCDEYYRSFVEQPYVWARAKNEESLNIFKNNQDLIIETIKINNKITAFGLKSHDNIETEITDIEIQDLSSQLASSKIKINKGDNVWDCCCGAGGKSLFVSENFNDFKLFVSDKRSTILLNLEKRFKKNKLKLPEIGEIDLEQDVTLLNFKNKKISLNFFDVIIADVPCSGSGTWAREPENLYFFNKEKIEEFVKKQLNVLKNSLKFLKPEGRLYYITCSVFDDENFKIIYKISKECNLKITNYEYLKGYEHGADNMFWAEMIKLN